MLGRGDVLGRYEIEDMIGIGGMAIVYRAKQLTLGRSVALKLLAAEFTSDDFRERFRREGKLAASLDHPNIVPVYDADEADGRLFIAMRLVEGETLAERVRKGGRSRRRRPCRCSSRSRAPSTPRTTPASCIAM